jgi:hypothetical protein
MRRRDSEDTYAESCQGLAGTPNAGLPATQRESLAASTTTRQAQGLLGAAQSIRTLAQELRPSRVI